MRASINLLAAIPKVRPATIASVIQPSNANGGHPPTTRNNVMYANGSAKIVCSILIMSRISRVLPTGPWIGDNLTVFDTCPRSVLFVAFGNLCLLPGDTVGQVSGVRFG